MAEQKRPPETLKRDELIAALEQSRQELSGDLLDVRNSLSVSRRVKSSFHRNTRVWLVGGAVVGFLLSRPLLRTGSRRRRDQDDDSDGSAPPDSVAPSRTSPHLPEKTCSRQYCRCCGRP